MDIQSIAKIIEFFEEYQENSQIEIKMGLPALTHKALQKELQDTKIINQVEFLEEFNITIKGMKFNFVIKEVNE